MNEATKNVEFQSPATGRRFRFGLRTLFVVVTVAAVGAWNFRSPPFEVNGNLSRSDAWAIVKVLSNDDRTKAYPILAVNENTGGAVAFIAKHYAEVGAVHVLLERKNAAWEITEVDGW